jgi:hypothetical protein
MPYKDPEKRKAHDKVYHAAHKERRNADSRAYHATHKEERAAADKVYREAHKEKRAATNRAWKASHKKPRAIPKITPRATALARGLDQLLHRQAVQEGTLVWALG